MEQLQDLLDFSKCYALDTIREILAKYNIVTDNNQVVTLQMHFSNKSSFCNNVSIRQILCRLQKKFVF